MRFGANGCSVVKKLNESLSHQSQRLLELQQSKIEMMEQLRK